MLDRLTNRARKVYQEHHDFFLLALLFTSFRFLTLLLFEPGGYILDWSGYYIPGADFAQLSDWGYYPAIHYWMDYPPLFPWLAVIIYRLSMLLPLWREPELWYNLLLGSVFLLFEMGNFVLIYAIALRLRGRDGAVRCAWLYAGLFFPLMTILFWFENVTLLFLLLGVYMIIARRPVWGGLAAGVGFMIKFVPAFVGPVALRVFPKTAHKITYAAVAALAALSIALPFLLTNPGFFLTTFIHQASRGPYETVWALLDGYYSGGATPPLEVRFDLATTTVPSPDSHFPYALVALVFVGIYLILYTRDIDWQNDLKVVAFCGLSISLFLIFSKGYSPQWIINLLPFIVLLMPDLRGVTYSLLLMGFNVLEFPIALVLLEGHTWLFALAVLLRTVLLVLVGVEFGLILFPSRMVKRSLGLALLSIVLLVLILSPPLGVLAVRQYDADRLAENAYGETIGYLRGQPAGGAIFTDPLLYRQVYSFLVRRHGLYLLEANESLPNALARLEGRHSSLYVVYVGSEDDQRSNPAVERWLSEQAFPVSVESLDNSHVTRYSTPSSALQEQAVEATFADQTELTSCAFEPGPSAPGEVLHVSLSWRSLHSKEGDYTIFVHLIDESERVWAQHDGGPGGGSRPTSSWQPGEEIVDHHGLALPADLPPGEYSLAIGLYDAATGERLLVYTGEGTAPSDRVLVGPVEIAPPTD